MIVNENVQSAIFLITGCPTSNSHYWLIKKCTCWDACMGGNIVFFVNKVHFIISIIGIEMRCVCAEKKDSD